MKKIENNEYLTLKISAKEAMYRAVKALTDGKEECSFKLSENEITGTNHPDFKGFGAAAWINKEKVVNENPVVTEERIAE